jgi:hypothetical protein
MLRHCLTYRGHLGGSGRSYLICVTQAKMARAGRAKHNHVA